MPCRSFQSEGGERELIIPFPPPPLTFMGSQWAPKQFGVQSTWGATRSLHQDRIPAAGEDFFVCAVASSFARLHLETIFLGGGGPFVRVRREKEMSGCNSQQRVDRRVLVQLGRSVSYGFFFRCWVHSRRREERLIDFGTGAKKITVIRDLSSKPYQKFRATGSGRRINVPLPCILRRPWTKNCPQILSILPRKT